MSVKREILGRVTVVYLIFLLIGMLIIGKILYLQIFEKQKWTDEANSYSLQTMTIDADRGSIYTADGRLLASSVPFYEVHFDARCENLTDRMFYKGVDSLSLGLSRLFGDKSAAAYRQSLVQARLDGKRYHLVKKGVNYIQLKALKKLPIFRLGRYKGGLVYMQENHRVRPHHNLAARLIGYTSADENGNPVGMTSSPQLT
jgi:cell division protein FtsI (penicillin-binding protein 3)